jgi:hypothetical protein
MASAAASELADGDPAGDPVGAVVAGAVGLAVGASVGDELAGGVVDAHALLTSAMTTATARMAGRGRCEAAIGCDMGRDCRTRIATRRFGRLRYRFLNRMPPRP